MNSKEHSKRIMEKLREVASQVEETGIDLDQAGESVSIGVLVQEIAMARAWIDAIVGVTELHGKTFDDLFAEVLGRDDTHE